MHRFRKRSDTRRSGQVPFAISLKGPDEQDSLPQLGLSNDFRTSLILPDLSRRFSLLRSSSDSFSLDHLKSRLAEQRARGSENHISEEEEDMILETLRGIRSKSAGTTQRSQDRIREEDDPSYRQSVQSTSTVGSSLAPSSLSSSPSGRSTKRYSNNLFGSGRFRDYTLRNPTKSGSTRIQSLTPTESSQSYAGNASSIIDSLRPVTPESSSLISSTQSSPNERASEQPSPLIPPSSYREQPLSVAEYRIAKTLGSSALKRASLALEEAIKEMEEEAEDEIVMPRISTPIPRTIVEQPFYVPETVRNSNVSQSSVFEAGMAISSDKQIHNDSEERRASPVPSRILPGYIPGMPRPMTPRDFDLDDQRSHSTTPRATSPIIAGFTDTSASSIPNNAGTSLLRRDSTSSQSRPSPFPLSSPTSALSIQRSTNGRQTPDASDRDIKITEFESPLNSSLLTRRRPASPLSGQPFQSLAVSSRPGGTPSNVIWTTNPSANQTPSGHSRSDSRTSDGGAGSTDILGTLDRPIIGARSSRSPVPPVFQVTENGQSRSSSSSSAYNSPSFMPESRPPSSVSTDFHSPARPTRSVTPTQNASRSPVSPTFSEYSIASKNGTKRSSKQNPLSSLFNMGLIPPLVFSSLANSSRSSLASDGSSYHTWDGEKDHCLTLFSEADGPQSAWHDLSPFDKSSSATPGGSEDEDWDAEEIVRRHAGLKKSDFMAIQEKLVRAAIAKDAGQEGRERAPSSLRRRRPSTSQSNYSVNGRDHRVASPPPQTQPPASPISPISDQNSKANALLKSMVESIQHAQGRPSTPDTTFSSSTPVPKGDLSPNSRRKRDLAKALFGREGAEQPGQTKSEQSIVQNPEQPPEPPVANTGPISVHNSLVSPSSITPYPLTRNPSTPRIPQPSQEEAQLTREVQQKINAATLALKKPPLNANLSADPYGYNSPASRKRILPNQISTPRFVSASTSVEAVPIPRAPSLSSANNSGPSRIGSRFKKLRGTLRSKNPLPTGDEVTPFPLDHHSSPTIQTAHYDPAKLRVPEGIAASATESRFKVSVPSPPASAGPGLKGFMARFRGKRVTTDTMAESDPRRSPLLSSTSAVPTSTQSARVATQPRMTPKPIQAVSSSSTLRATRPTRSAPAAQVSLETVGPTNSNESTALQQLFDAANDLGLDQGALNALLARSASTSSRTTEWTMLTRNNSTTEAVATTPVDPSRLTPTTSRPSIDNQSTRAETPDPKTIEHANGRHNADSPSPRDGYVSEQPSVRKQAGYLRRAREGQSDSRAISTIIRRTIIYPSESRASPIDLGTVTRRNSSRRKRASATSVSSRSVHDRAPTPPPPRSPTSKRFSHSPSPPVPNLPPSLISQADNLLTVPSISAGGAIETSNSTYDSLYDMYTAASSAASDSNTPDASLTHGDLLPTSEARPAVEVIELANGQTIWSIVNGLRSDEESVYTGRVSRASLASEYSTRENGEGGLQVFVKEHGRSGSKGSNSSFLSRKRTLQGQQRPETKVFYSSSEQIGRLIENLSQGMDAGSFNFLPNPTSGTPGHSATSSSSTNDIHWTVEERLEHMLGSMKSL